MSQGSREEEHLFWENVEMNELIECTRLFKKGAR